MTAIRGARVAEILASPADAATASSGGPSLVPASSRRSPAFASVPRRCTWRQGSGRHAGASSASPSATRSCSMGTTVSQPVGRIAPVITSKQSPSASSASGGIPAAWTPATRKRRRPGSPARNAMPSMATRSKGGASRSAKRGCRRMRPAQAASGTSSGDTGTMAAAIAASASAGVSTGTSSASVLLVAGLEDPQLLVEAVCDRLDLVHRGVVLLGLHGAQLRQAILVVLAALLEVRHLEVEAGVVGVDVLVELLHRFLRRNHLVVRRGRAVGQRRGRARIDGGRMGRTRGGECEQGKRQTGHFGGLPLQTGELATAAGRPGSQGSGF